MRLPFFVLLVLLVTACAEREGETLPPTAPSPSPEPRRALWVLAEGSHRTLEDPARIDRLVEDASNLGATDLLVQVYRAGRCWFPSRHADDTPYRNIEAASGKSPLRRLLDRAHAEGLRVHAWFNALSLAQNEAAPLLRHVGRQAVLVDREGRSLLDYPKHDVPAPDRIHTRLGTPGVWLDPAVPGVIEYLEQTLDDLVQAAPDLDGLHLDYIRHPLALPLIPGSRFDLGLDFGYGDLSRARYERERGMRFRRGDDWDAFRRDQVSEVVQRLGARLPENWELSGAVLPWADRAYLVAMQDWRRWLEEGWMDFVVAMAYTRDDRLLRYVAHHLRGGIGGERVWLGLGTWLFLRKPERIQAQILLTLDAAPAGIALFSYDALAGAPEVLEGIRWTSE
jgi:uncharacterized lipoprotein YddW (UPF0748 family)